MDDVTIKSSLVSMVSEIRDLTPKERIDLTKEWYSWIIEKPAASVHRLGVIQ